MSSIQNRYEFVYLFDVSDGNPNGDPDAGNMPRVDPETNQGLVSDVCLKRKVRNYVQLEKEGSNGFDIYMQEGAVLNQQQEKAYKARNIEPDKTNKRLPKNKDDARALTAWMCEHFFDVRAFGAVMTTEVNCGQVRGPIQMAFARSIDPIVPMGIAITRMAVTNDKAQEKERTMARKHVVPYGLYRAHGFISAKLAERTSFSPDDLELFWRALEQMFEHDRSAARGEMSARKLIVFQHENALGNAPAYVLFDRVNVTRRDAAGGLPARRFEDYEVTVSRDDLPAGVQIEERL
jgi:CRISPR-associated protein Csd2